MIISTLLLCVAVGGAIAMGAKYAFGPVPATYHAEIIAKDGATAGHHTLMVLEVLYRVMGSALISMAILMLFLALGPVRAGDMMALVVAVAAASVVAVPSGLVAYRIEKTAGVKTPWRVSAILQGVLVLALVAAIL